MSPFAGTNDLWESRPLRPNLEGALPDEDPHGIEAFGIWEDVDRYIRGYSKVACFTQDWELPDSAMNRDALRGWSHLSLWAHYGAGHKGVCLRFDRDLLLAAFDSARGEAIHQFHGPVVYRRAEFGIGPHGIKLAQAAEYGVDAVALHYANVHRKRVFFRKHADWENESEFRLVRSDMTTRPHYIDVSRALTGVVLGDSFPSDRLPALFRMLSEFDGVTVEQALFHNRFLRLVPVEQVGPDVVDESGILPSSSNVQPRRSGDLSSRLRSLELAEGITRDSGSTGT